MMARSKCSNQRPDTLMQDRSPPARRNHLQRTAGPYIWVISRQSVSPSGCPLCTGKRTSEPRTGMSALRHFRTHAVQRFWCLFDHLVGSHLHRQRHREAKRLRGLEIDEVLEFLWLLHRKIGWFFASEDAVEIGSNLPNLRQNVEIVRDQAARPGATNSAPINGRN